jgi:hypothetical protein
MMTIKLIARSSNTFMKKDLYSFKIHLEVGQQWDPPCLNVFQDLQTPLLNYLNLFDALQVSFGGVFVINICGSK